MTRFHRCLVAALLVAFQLTLSFGKEEAMIGNPKGTTKLYDGPLPVFLFHGVNADATIWKSISANLTAEGHPVFPLQFCTGACAKGDLNHQVTVAAMHITLNVRRDSRFRNGYIFVGHSQGAVLARAVMEVMEDHRVKAFISLAGPQMGIFYGPQTTDLQPAVNFLESLGPWLLSTTNFNVASYSRADLVTGKLSCDFSDFWFTHAKLKLAAIDLARSPVDTAWRYTGDFLPVINNVNPIGTRMQGEGIKFRRRNFLRVQQAHFFGSPGDDVLAPWQTAIFGRYQSVGSSKELRESFASLKVIGMNATDEYNQDTFGLRTLDKANRLFLHVVPQVTHSCWLKDYIVDGNIVCKFQDVYDNYVYPVIHAKY